MKVGDQWKTCTVLSIATATPSTSCCAPSEITPRRAFLERAVNPAFALVVPIRVIRSKKNTIAILRRGKTATAHQEAVLLHGFGTELWTLERVGVLIERLYAKQSCRLLSCDVSDTSSPGSKPSGRAPDLIPAPSLALLQRHVGT